MRIAFDLKGKICFTENTALQWLKNATGPEMHAYAIKSQQVIHKELGESLISFRSFIRLCFLLTLPVMLIQQDLTNTHVFRSYLQVLIVAQILHGFFQ
jgi:O-acetylhomoserine/O-acetylserine sulfhydrylase-like pyridoxal-dependent enzyme